MSHSWDSDTNLDHLRRLDIVQLRHLLEDEETLLRAVRSSTKVLVSILCTAGLFNTLYTDMWFKPSGSLYIYIQKFYVEPF